MRDKAVMMSSTTPSAKYSCSGSPLQFWNGSAAIEGESGRANSGAGMSSSLRGSIFNGPALSGAWATQTSDESEPFAGNGPDQTLVVAVVADRLARCID